MQTLELNKMELAPLADFELQAITGGTWSSLLRGVTWAAIGKEIIDNWDDIKQGLADGWNSLK